MYIKKTRGAVSKFKPEMLTVVEYMKRQGCTDKSVYKKLKISYNTFYRWLKESDEFNEAYKRGKDNSDDFMCLTAESSLMKLIAGYTYTQETTKLIPGAPDKNGNSKPQIREKTIKTVTVDPSVAAIIYTLNNRMPERWSNNGYNVGAEELEVNIDLTIEDNENNKDKS